MRNTIIVFLGGSRSGRSSVWSEIGEHEQQDPPDYTDQKLEIARGDLTEWFLASFAIRPNEPVRGGRTAVVLS
jgi:hypothetical protein